MLRWADLALSFLHKSMRSSLNTKEHTTKTEVEALITEFVKKKVSSNFYLINLILGSSYDRTTSSLYLIHIFWKNIVLGKFSIVFGIKIKVLRCIQAEYKKTFLSLKNRNEVSSRVLNIVLFLLSTKRSLEPESSETVSES